MCRGKKIKLFLCFILVSIFVFMFSYFVLPIFCDEIWNYGFGYNISVGLVPYKDFNMVVTPLYSFIVALFIKIFGHHLWSMHIFNSIMVSFMLFIMYRKIKNKIFILLPYLFFILYPGYNLFTLFLVIVLIELCDVDFKNKDFWLGFVVGVLFLTKQTIGLCIFLPMIYYSKSKFKSLFGFCIPIFVLSIYLLLNGAFYNFIDYCFLGMFDFASGNKILYFFPTVMLIILFFSYFLIKSKFSDKFAFYVIMFQIINFPIFDFSHFFVAFFLVLYYLLFRFNLKILNLFFVVFAIALFIKCDFNIYFFHDKDSYLNGRNCSDSCQYISKSLIFSADYIEDFSKQYDNVFIFSDLSYVTKMNIGYKITKYDLINDGNMGYNGDSKYVKEIGDICKSHSCVFILDDFYAYSSYKTIDDYNQTNVKIISHVRKNYKKIGEENGFVFYSN